MSYSRIPREQGPEINFNRANIATVLPGASAEGVEQRITNPLEDSIGNVKNVKFVVSFSRESASNILVRFRDVPVRVFDKRPNDLRREIQNKANAELPVEILDPEILEITTSIGFPTAMVVLAGQADDEPPLATARAVSECGGPDRYLAARRDPPQARALPVRRQTADPRRFRFRRYRDNAGDALEDRARRTLKADLAASAQRINRRHSAPSARAG